MKKPLFLVMCIIIATSLSGCSGNSLDISSNYNASVQRPVYPQSISFEDYDGKRSIMDNNPIDKSYINAMNSFTYDSAYRLLKGGDDNLCYSPISLYMALSLAGTGADGKTQDEMFSTLGVKESDYLSEQNGNLYRLLYLDNEIGKLKIANSIWIQEDGKFKDKFISNAIENFYASLYKVDFADKDTGKLMSKWISDNTNGILSPEITLDKEQIMSIINTIYFKDEWINRFDEDKTKPDIFYLDNGSEVECDFMNARFISHGFTKGEGFTSSSLSLKNNGSMVFILPDKGVSLDDLLSSPEKISKLFNEERTGNGEVIFKIPKFSFGSDFNLKSMLQSMGIKSAFQPDADFTNITEGTAFISNINHQAHIAIDEKGIEAAAFTKLDYAGSAMPDGKAEMILDRPFIFAVKSHTGTILFAGIVNNPKDV